jgi:putative spermidine/putrescine transport system ATP-binding protein
LGAPRAVDRVTLAIEPGSIVALLGPSGCGKTTTLRMIAGLLQPEAGEILIDDKAITRIPVHRRNIGMLFQNYALFPHMTVAQNIAFGLETRGVRREAAAVRVREALQLVQLGDFGDRMPGQLSGGQQQRVALARALVVQPAVLLLDEPLGALDKSLRQSMQVELRDLQRRLGITTVMVTHDQDEALTMADRVAIMRDGYLEQTGTPAEVYLRPVSRFIASFLGAANFFRGRVERSANGSSLVAVPGGLTISIPVSRSVGGWVTVALRPESVKVRIAGAANGAADVEAGVNEVHAVVEKVVYHGFVSHLYLRRRNGDELIAFRQNESSASGPGIDPGTRVCAFWPEESNHVVRDEAAAVPGEAAAE